jgi:ribonuclease D
VIDSSEKLQELIGRLGDAEWIALDLEADSMHSYPEKICLIQITTSGGDELIDPLADFDVAPLFAALKGRGLILHGCDYDLRMLKSAYAFRPTAIFDTMEAARLIGLREFGYAAVARKLLNVELDKGPQRANWSIRPLTERMEVYARNDTHYLQLITGNLRERLEELGRFEWFQETCERLLSESENARPVDRDRVWRIKGSFRFRPHELAALKELWLWREEEAVESNRPPFFIMRHDALVSIAENAANERPYDEFIPRRMASRRKRGLQDAVDRGVNCPEPDQPQRIRNKGVAREATDPAKFDEIKNVRNRNAAALDIDPTLIASRVVLERLIDNWDLHSPNLMSWQRRLLEDSAD